MFIIQVYEKWKDGMQLVVKRAGRVGVVDVTYACEERGVLGLPLMFNLVLLIIRAPRVRALSIVGIGEDLNGGAASGGTGQTSVVGEQRRATANERRVRQGERERRDDWRAS
jgi:hypothetical protein